MHLGFASAAVVPLGSEGDPGCIFFTLKTYQTTLIGDICETPEGSEVSFWTDGKNRNGRKRMDGQTDVEVEIVV